MYLHASRAGILRSVQDRAGPPRHSDIVLSLDSDYSVTATRLTTETFSSVQDGFKDEYVLG